MVYERIEKEESIEEVVDKLLAVDIISTLYRS